jgi:hypothetical protein
MGRGGYHGGSAVFPSPGGFTRGLWQGPGPKGEVAVARARQLEEKLERAEKQRRHDEKKWPRSVDDKKPFSSKSEREERLGLRPKRARDIGTPARLHNVVVEELRRTLARARDGASELLLWEPLKEAGIKRPIFDQAVVMMISVGWVRRGGDRLYATAALKASRR